MTNVGAGCGGGAVSVTATAEGVAGDMPGVTEAGNAGGGVSVIIHGEQAASARVIVERMILCIGFLLSKSVFLVITPIIRARQAARILL
jgi:hypothetical protein